MGHIRKVMASDSFLRTGPGPSKQEAAREGRPSEWHGGSKGTELGRMLLGQ